jgi:hypothetical protein
VFGSFPAVGWGKREKKTKRKKQKGKQGKMEDDTQKSRQR